ncbi:hypothetical protein LCGC14_2420770, partial [marine sediment metagenome]
MTPGPTRIADLTLAAGLRRAAFAREVFVPGAPESCALLAKSQLNICVLMRVLDHLLALFEAVIVRKRDDVADYV